MSLLTIDPDSFRDAFDRRPFVVRHGVAADPRLTLEALRRLAAALPRGAVEWNAGDIPVALDGRPSPKTGLGLDATFDALDRRASWVALKNIEQHPDYAALVEPIFTEVREHSEPVRPGFHQPEAFVFVSSAGSVTPYHMDPEHNFLLQVRGGKTVTVVDGQDRTRVSEQALEQFYSGRMRSRNLEGDAAALEAGETPGVWRFALAPGDGLHIPVTFPHFVRVGDAVSISLSVTFRTPDLERRRRVHSVNARLRDAGVTPAPVGERPWRDSVKAESARALSAAKRLTTRRTPR
jgi:hypothetical protein